MSAASVERAAQRYCTLSRGALHLLERVGDDLAGMTMAREAHLSIWAEEVEFVQDVLSAALKDLDAALNPRA